MSAAAEKVLGKLGEMMAEMATTDPDQWEQAEVVAFADGIHMIDGVMQAAKAQLVSNG